MKEILEYLKQTYDPVSVVVYGSYADGTWNEHSDFDALVISHSGKRRHDVSVVSDIQLDVFVYPKTHFGPEFDGNELVQLVHSKIVLDTDGFGERVKDAVVRYHDQLPMKSPEEVREAVVWCGKMLRRTERGDAESFYRWHWVLVDSLEFFCDIVRHRYYGPKKTLRWMAAEYPEAFALYERALNSFSKETLERWIGYLEKSFSGDR